MFEMQQKKLLPVDKAICFLLDQTVTFPIPGRKKILTKNSIRIFTQ